MTLIGLQRRFRELGRVRLGEKGHTQRNGRDVAYPKKLTGFRLTSQSRALLLVAADLYGGEVRKWEGAPGQGDQWEVYIGDRIDIFLPPGEPLSQSFELWSGGGCTRRCNGMATGDGEPCLCPANIEERMEAAAAGKACKPTTRLSVILPRLPDIGVWRMETRGYNAAVELPGTVDLLRTLTEDGKMIPAFLRIEQRTSVKDGETRHFVVPVLELPTVTVAELQSRAAPEVGQGATPALPAGLDDIPRPGTGGRVTPAGDEAATSPEASDRRGLSPRTAGSTALRGAQPPTPPPLEGEQPADPATVAEMVELMNHVKPSQRLAECMNRFKERFGPPSGLLAHQVEAAWEFLAGYTAVPPEPARKGGRTPASMLHMYAKDDPAVSDEDFDIILLNVTLGRTSSAKELSPSEDGKARVFIRAVKDGTMKMDDIRAKVAEFRQAAR